MLLGLLLGSSGPSSGRLSPDPYFSQGLYEVVIGILLGVYRVSIRIM